ncbi:Cytochrome c-type biogenesis protein [Nymphaea thermarum]|nr:Cytochrome c-type biogenesis protein [Nymphaea thermarum]
MKIRATVTVSAAPPSKEAVVKVGRLRGPATFPNRWAVAPRTPSLVCSSAGRKRSSSSSSLQSLFRLPPHHQIETAVLDSSHPWTAAPLFETFHLSRNSGCSRNGTRFLATLRRQPARPRTVDIGARARQLQNRRLWTYALTFSGIAGFVIIVLNNFQDQMMFYLTPTDALDRFSLNPSKNKFRLGGLVLEGSVVQPAESPEMQFVITDLVTDILVRYQGSLPDLFREGHSAVVEGFIRPFDAESREVVPCKPALEKARKGDCYFDAIEVLAKHDEKYMPKEVAAAIERNKAALEAAHSGLSDAQQKAT